jgi:hypothetical protein
MAFNTLQDSKRLHQTAMLLLPKFWHKLKDHPFGTQFYKAANMEYTDLVNHKTFIKVDIPTGKQVIPVKWVFSYKFDSKGYLKKFKAQLVVRGNLQIFSHKDIRATTLAARIF